MLFFPVALLLNFSELRKLVLSKPILAVFRKVAPKLSATEQAALNAGDVWWDGELFSGRPNWSKLLTIPPATLSEEEQEFMDGPVDELVITSYSIHYTKLYEFLA